MAVSAASASEVITSATPAHSTRDYRPDIDGLRAIAATSVVAAHAAVRHFAGGALGVDIFFVISGYLISGILLRALLRQQFSIADFYARRVKRIFPALLTVFATLLMVGWFLFLPDEFQRLGKDVASGAGFILNFIWYGDIYQFYAGVPLLNHLWTLGVEEQFYLVWPLFLLAAWQLRRGRLALIAAPVLISYLVSALTVGGDMLAWYLLPWNRLWELGLGAVVAYLQLEDADDVRWARAKLATHLPDWLRRHGFHLMGVLGAGLLAEAMLGPVSSLTALVWRQTAAAAGAALLIAAGAQSWINRHILKARPLVLVGLVSYPLYLWHFPLLGIARLLDKPQLQPGATLIAVAAAFVLAFATYRFIELPVRALPRNASVALVLCLLMSGCGIIGYMAARVPARAELEGVAKVVRATREDWFSGSPEGEWTQGESGFVTLGGGARRVLFIGDSNMQQYYPRVAQLLVDHPENSRGAVFAARDWCAPGGTQMLAIKRSARLACDDYLRDVVSYANDPSVDTVVIAACWYLYFVDHGGTFPADSFGQPGALLPGTEQALVALRTMVAGFVGAGKRVYLVLDSPLGADFDPHQMIRRAVLSPGFSVDSHGPRRVDVALAFEPIAARLRTLARESHAQIIDPMMWLCDDRICPNMTPEGDPMYHDMWRLRPSYVRNNVRYLDQTILDFGETPTLRE